jgi:DNA repair protein RadC
MWRVKEFYEPEDFPKEEKKADNTNSSEQNEAHDTECPSRSGSLPTGEGGGRGQKGSSPASSFPITSWSEDDRPREKLSRIGAENLSNAELLAILIGSGNTKESAVDLMKRILKDCDNNLGVLGRKSIAELTEYNGIGEAKAISILAACELGKRREHEEARQRIDLGSPDGIYKHLLPKIRDLDVEEAYIVLMNNNFKHIKTVRLSHGGITETAVDVRLIIKEAVLCNATVVALAHNHPSGNIQPSGNDDQITRQVQRACDAMRLHFLDHVIVTDGAYFSYHESGKL